ncbi:uncharacterized protein STEHIDRAFT_156136 [Stereum hirsutum FP-91666 SS1]|uniref:uncharacterized protein n=1 Tax=Stereum hirsutum (strain FP-91666) TaxID=721885 RepID=UPI000440C50A|nr:uncharacterized protein STEHIDRAFT_156136 [Stereum hirsutum FP-91666 SS1]EIM87148.1 hypothetical protein STEHIDRAFT_156136 [Stereum hirsutum FP-91666 SS1]
MSSAEPFPSPSPALDSEAETPPNTLELTSLPQLFAIPEFTLTTTETIVFNNSLSGPLVTSTHAAWTELSLPAIKLLQPAIARNLRRLEILLFEGSFDLDLLPLPQLTHFTSRTDLRKTGLDLLQLFGKLLGCERLVSLELSLCGLGVNAGEAEKGEPKTKIGPAGSIGRMRFWFAELRELKLMTDDMETMEAIISAFSCSRLETLKLEVERPAQPPPSTTDLASTEKNTNNGNKTKEGDRTGRGPNISIPDSGSLRSDDLASLKLGLGIERLIRGCTSTLTELETNLWPRLWHEGYFADSAPANAVRLAVYDLQDLRSLTLTGVDWKDEKMVWFLEDLTLEFEEASGDEGSYVVLKSGNNVNLTSISLRAPHNLDPEPETNTKKRKASPPAEPPVSFADTFTALVTMLSSRYPQISDGTQVKHPTGQSFAPEGLKTFETGAAELRLMREHAMEEYMTLIDMWESGLGGLDLQSVAGVGARISYG